MPELDIERQPDRGVPGWVWVLGALLLIGLVWWIASRGTGRQEVAQVTPDQQVAGTREETAPAGQPGETPATAVAGALPLAAVRENPGSYYGQSVSGTATVAEIIREDAFWVEQDGQRLLVVKDALISLPELQPGQQISMEGYVRDPRELPQIPGMPELEEATRTLLEAEPAFIHATAVEAQNA